MGSPDLIYVSTQDVDESMEVGCCGDVGMDGECFIGVWYATDGSAVIQVIGIHYTVHRQQLASGGAESATSAGKVGADGKYLG